MLSLLVYFCSKKKQFVLSCLTCIAFQSRSSLGNVESLTIDEGERAMVWRHNVHVEITEHVRLTVEINDRGSIMGVGGDDADADDDGCDDNDDSDDFDDDDEYSCFNSRMSANF